VTVQLVKPYRQESSIRKAYRLESSNADPGCLSPIPDPDFYPSRIPDLGSWIPDPKTAAKKRGGKKVAVTSFFVATSFT